MTEIASTRLRYISAEAALDLSIAVSGLPSKVELKNIVFDNKRWYAWFVIPDNVKDFISQDL